MISRRSFAGSAPLAAAAVLFPFRSQAGEPEITALDPLETMVRLRSRTDGEISMAWLEADREIVFDGLLYPFCKLHNLMLTSFSKDGDAFIARTFEVSYYCDPQSGELLDTALLPGADEAVEVPIYRSGPSDVRYKESQDEWIDLAGATAPGTSVHHIRSVAVPKVRGDKVFLKSDEYVRVYAQREGPPSIFYRDWMTWQADIADVLDTGNPDVPSSFSYAAATDLRPWMKLDPRRGHTLSSGVGAKIQNAAQLPGPLAKLLKEHDPRALNDPRSYFH